MVDADRQISLEFVGTTGPEERGNAFALSHDDLRIPLHTVIDTDPVDAGGGQLFVSWRFVFFGRGMYREQDGGATPYAFGTEEEASRWRRIAAEAALTFGYSYDGFRSDPAYIRFVLDRTYLSRRDFGYAQ